MTVTIEQMIACARRELALRQRVYPAWVAKSKMKQAEMDKELAAMQAIHDELTNIQQHGTFEKLGPDSAHLQLWRGTCGHHWIRLEAVDCPICKLASPPEQHDFGPDDVEDRCRHCSKTVEQLIDEPFCEPATKAARERLAKSTQDVLNMLMLCGELGGQKADEPANQYLRRLIDGLITARLALKAERAIYQANFDRADRLIHGLSLSEEISRRELVAGWKARIDAIDKALEPMSEPTSKQMSCGYALYGDPAVCTCGTCPLKPNEYRCAYCRGIFEKGQSDEAAQAEFAEKFGRPFVEDEVDIVCDDCWKKMGHG